MEHFELTRDQFEVMRKYQVNQRRDWPVALSCNCHRDIWPPIGLGFTHPRDRMYLQGRIPILGRIVEVVLAERPEGGRFFVDDNGIYISRGEFGTEQVANLSMVNLAF